MEVKKIDLGNNSYFLGEELIIGKDFKIGKNNIIRAKKAIIGNYVTIGDNNETLIGGDLIIDDCSYIGNKNSFTAREIKLGQYLFLDSNIVIGHGGKFNYDSYLTIGDYCMICSFVKLNINYNIKIGNNVGIGEYVDVWTHGSYLPILEGFPSQFGSVEIGNNVWLPTKSIIMPNVKIGDNVVVGANSVITKELPSGSLCGGIPAKILKENVFPKVLTKENKQIIIEEILKEYEKLANFKELNFKYFFDKDKLQISINEILFDFNTYKVIGELDAKAEDFRDFLRRRGIKFFTGRPFYSILPPEYERILNMKNSKL